MLFSPDRIELNNQLHLLQGRIDDLEGQLETQNSQGVSEYSSNTV